jgi:hypothetical protein
MNIYGTIKEHQLQGGTFTLSNIGIVRLQSGDDSVYVYVLIYIHVCQHICLYIEIFRNLSI